MILHSSRSRTIVNCSKLTTHGSFHRNILTISRTSHKFFLRKCLRQFSSSVVNSPNKEYYKHRRLTLENITQQRKMKLYPAYSKKMSVAMFINQFSDLKNNEGHSQEVELCGRVILRRVMGKIIFLNLQENGHKIQVKFSSDTFQDFEFCKEHIRRNDIISVKGTPSRTLRGELTIIASLINLLVPCLHDLPDFNHLTDPDSRYRQRYIDMLVNRGVIEIFKMRSKIVKTIRSYLDGLDFIEVETPMLHNSVGGALANPFLTHSHTLNSTLALRIAPELSLKQLVIGGMERVYEIGKNFRNEGIDSTHNPEFTMCEFYQAYSDYYQLMDMTEELLRKIVYELYGTYNISVPIAKEKDTFVDIDFSKPFQRISLLDELERLLGTTIPNLDSSEASAFLLELCEKHRLLIPTPASTIDLFETLVGNFIESQCVRPTFLMDYPILNSPLARRHRSKEGVTERFELFIGKMEICNAYTELNDPEQQRQNFHWQAKENRGVTMDLLKTGENETNYVKSLEYGLPPTAGWGLGIDRLTMLLTGKSSIREVILFPTLKQK